VNIEFCEQSESTHDFLLSGLYKIHFLSPMNLWKLIKNKGTELICTSDISYKNSLKINWKHFFKVFNEFWRKKGKV